MKQVTAFVAECLSCQLNKYDTRTPVGLLQLLPIPEQIWEDISMDFILVGLKHPYTACMVAQVFTKEIMHLHDIPWSIVSNRDPIFVSSFWTKLFRMSGTKLRMSSAYHPQIDGQTEVLNRCLEMYLRCFTFEQPKQWEDLLHWFEFCFTSGFHSAAACGPYAFRVCLWMATTRAPTIPPERSASSATCR